MKLSESIYFHIFIEKQLTDFLSLYFTISTQLFWVFSYGSDFLSYFLTAFISFPWSHEKMRIRDLSTDIFPQTVSLFFMYSVTHYTCALTHSLFPSIHPNTIHQVSVWAQCCTWKCGVASLKNKITVNWR